MIYTIPAKTQAENPESSLRRAGSDLWFSGLGIDWQDFLVKQVELCAHQYQIPMDRAALAVLRVYQAIVIADPSVKEANPWKLDGAFPSAA